MTSAASATETTGERRHDLAGQVAIVTGGGRGLGEALCRVLAESGATVVPMDFRSELITRVADDINASGGRALPKVVDVTDDAGTAAVIDGVVEEFGRIDVLINNAGTDLTVSVEEMPIDQWDRIIAVNLRGPFVLAKRVLPHMRQAGRGHIVNIASTAAKRAWANASAYHASKWGLLGFSHALHVEARAFDVKVTAIIAGGMRTPFLLDRFPDIDLRNLQDPRSVAEAVRYVLLQPEGTVIPEMTVLPMRETSWP